MQKLPHYLMALALMVFAIGCDSNNEEEPALTAAEKIIGVWLLTGVTDAQGDQLATFLQDFNGVTATFNNTGTYTLFVDAIDDTQDLNLNGPYGVNEVAGILSLTVEVPGIPPIALALSFTFIDDDNLTLSGNSALINPLLQTGLDGTATLAFSRM